MQVERNYPRKFQDALRKKGSENLILSELVEDKRMRRRRRKQSRTRKKESRRKRNKNIPFLFKKKIKPIFL